MATINHANCTHPRTPAGRAACRKARTNAVQVTAGVVKTDGTAGRMIVAPRRARRAPVKTHTVPAKFSGLVDVASVRGWAIRNGDPYNDTETRVLITSDRGELAIVWNVRGGTGLFFRPCNSSITSGNLLTVAAGIAKLAGDA